jgi:hypothetical protein
MKNIEGRESLEEGSSFCRGLGYDVSRHMFQLSYSALAMLQTSYSALGLPLPCSNAHVLQGIPGKVASMSMYEVQGD